MQTRWKKNELECSRRIWLPATCRSAETISEFPARIFDRTNRFVVHLHGAGRAGAVKGIRQEIADLILPACRADQSLRVNSAKTKVQLQGSVILITLGIDNNSSFNCNYRLQFRRDQNRRGASAFCTAAP